MVTRLLPWVLLALAAVVYARQLGDMPTYISPDEAIIAVDAHAVATTGRDVRGTFLPLYFFIQVPNSERSGWFTPVIFYLSAAVQRVVPFSEAAIRLPSVIVGLTSIGLLFILARRVLGNVWLALMTAALLAMSPALYIFSRYGLDYLYPVPFVIAWAIALHRALENPTPGAVALCGACLGLGFYSYAAAVVLTPPLLLLSIIVLWPSVPTATRVLVAAGGFVLMLVPFAVWFASHPDAFANTASRYALYNPQQLSPLQGLREFLSFQNIERMTAIYWSYLSPSVLFFSGDQLVTFSTRNAGVFPMIGAVLMLLGLAQIVEHERNRFAWAMFAAFLLAPVPAVLVPENGAVNRATAILPFGMLLAGYGLKLLWSVRSIPHSRWLAAIGGAGMLVLGGSYAAWTLAQGRLGGASVPLIALGVILAGFAWLSNRLRQGAMLAAAAVLIASMQFASFQRDYHGDYRVRINSWLGGNLRGALEQIIDRCAGDACARVYFAHLQSTGGVADIRNYWMDAYWRFYLIKHNRESLLAKTVHADPGPISGIPAGSLVLGNHGDRVIESMVAAGELVAVSSIPEMGGDPYFMLLEKRGS